MWRALRPWAVVFLLGGLFGFVIAAIGGGLAEERAVFGQHETAAARTYIISLLENEPQSLIALSPKTDVVNRAMQFAQAEGAAGTVSVHIYAIELRAANGQRQFFPLALTLVGGKVVRRE